MTRRDRAATGCLVLSVLAAVALAQDPNLDLPVHPSTHRPVAQVSTLTRTRAPLSAPVPPPVEDDPRDEPPPVFYGEEIDAEGDVIIYVIDVSCSMQNGTRMEDAQRELSRSIRGLAPSFRFNVVAYSCQLRNCWPSLRRADDAHKAAALAFVARMNPHSGTATGPGVAQALQERACMSVVLLTDGAPNCGAEGADGHRRMIRDSNTQRATISVFGIDASGPYRAFCIGVATDSGGSYVDVP